MRCVVVLALFLIGGLGCGRVGFSVIDCDGTAEACSAALGDAELALDPRCFDLAAGLAPNLVVGPDGGIELAPSASSGVFTSAICSTAIDGVWQELTPRPQAPYGKHLAPVDELGYSEGGMSAVGLAGWWSLELAGSLTPNTIVPGSGDAARAASQDGENVDAAPGLIGGGAAFDGEPNGTNEFIATTLNIGAAPAKSLVGWFYFASSPASYRVMMMETMAWDVDTYVGLIGDLDEIYLYQSTNGGSSSASLYTTNVPLGQWVHVVGVIDAGGLSIYINGLEVAQAFTTGLDPGTFYDTLGTVNLGGGEAGHEFDGRIDEAAIYTRRLSGVEIQALHERGAFLIEYQARACAAPDCSDATFVGPDGTGASWFSEAANTAPGLPVFSPPATRGRYFQWRARLSGVAPGVGPRLLGASGRVTPDTPR